MYCSNCGTKLEAGAKFCPNCGQEIASASIEKKVEDDTQGTSEAEDTSGSWLDNIVTFGGVVGGFVLGKYLGLMMFVFLFAILGGIGIANWYAKRKNMNVQLLKFIAWSNVVTWLLPPLGMLSGFASLTVGNYRAEKKFFKILGLVGILAAIANATVGALMAMGAI